MDMDKSHPQAVKIIDPGWQAAWVRVSSDPEARAVYDAQQERTERRQIVWVRCVIVSTVAIVAGVLTVSYAALAILAQVSR